MRWKDDATMNELVRLRGVLRQAFHQWMCYVFGHEWAGITHDYCSRCFVTTWDEQSSRLCNKATIKGRGLPL